jgi:N-acetylglucosaminyldiphosphoundecaprenol N-acetyl-beta-D-mannosaminyltransferase
VSPAASPARIELLGCPVDPVTLEEAVGLAEAAIANGAQIQHVAINAAKVVRARHEPDLRAAIEGCELATADGQAVVWAGRVLGKRIPERVAGIDLMDALLAASAEHGHRVYLLGARAEVLARAEAALLARFPGANVVGRHHGYFGRAEEDELVGEIAAAKPDLLFVALETPAKETFLARHRDRLGIPFVMGVGGAFDIAGGLRKRAPRWMRRAGLEWLYRLAQDPRRLARRYVVGNTVFTWLVVRELAGRLRPGPTRVEPGLQDRR